MASQNRVDPWGRVIRSSKRGYFMGNRDFGDAWITCSLRSPDGAPGASPITYKKLFFLDEATALAAGHRPCGQCRRKDYSAFRRLGQSTTAMPIDATLRQEMADMAAGNHRRLRADKLPSGAMFDRDGKAYLAWQRIAYFWSPAGYTVAGLLKDLGTVRVLTPPSTLAALDAGYRPWVHPTVLRP